LQFVRVVRSDGELLHNLRIAHHRSEVVPLLLFVIVIIVNGRVDVIPRNLTGCGELEPARPLADLRERLVVLHCRRQLQLITCERKHLLPAADRAPVQVCKIAVAAQHDAARVLKLEPVDACVDTLAARELR
jgi:hypothetical protein